MFLNYVSFTVCRYFTRVFQILLWTMEEGEQQDVYESAVVPVVEEIERFGQSLEMAVERIGREDAWRIVQQYFDGMHNAINV